ncbi:hypothetical protein [Sorangium sp. So ce854]
MDVGICCVLSLRAMVRRGICWCTKASKMARTAFASDRTIS